MNFLRTIEVKTFFIVFIFLTALTLPQQSNAQFWKKIFNKHHKEERNKTRSEAADRAGISENSFSVRKRILPVYPATIKKERYRIDVLLPVELNKYVVNGKLVATRFPASLVSIINFYQGLRLSAEELNAEGVTVDLYVVDVGENGGRVQEMISSGRLRDADLIIGYLQSDQLDKVAQFAQEHHINFLSAFSPSDAGILGNPYFIILQPTLETHINKIVSFSEQSYSGIAPILLYSDNTSVQKESKKIFEKALHSKKWDSLSCIQFLHNPNTLLQFMDSSRVNVIFLNLLSYQEAATVLKKISKLSGKYKFAVFGMPSWKYLPGISGNKTYPNVDIYFSSPFYFDLRSVRGNEFVLNYRKAFGGTPSEMVFRGYETLYWSAMLLNTYGTIFNDHVQDSRMSPFTRFDISPSWTPKNKFEFLENKNLYIFHYLNGYSNIEE